MHSSGVKTMRAIAILDFSMVLASAAQAAPDANVTVPLKLVWEQYTLDSAATHTKAGSMAADNTGVIGDLLIKTAGTKSVPFVKYSFSNGYDRYTGMIASAAQAASDANVTVPLKLVWEQYTLDSAATHTKAGSMAADNTGVIGDLLIKTARVEGVLLTSDTYADGVSYPAKFVGNL